MFEGGVLRGGRFGWKNQHASLLSFASDAYLNEQGITNRFNLVDTTSVCTTTDPEDVENDIDQFATFMRIHQSAARRRRSVGHTRSAGWPADLYPDRLRHLSCCFHHNCANRHGNQRRNLYRTRRFGRQIIHPYGDFLLHDIGTGDGIVQNGPPDTQNKLRTAPLWGLRTRDRLMHDGASATREQAILRHKGEASVTRNKFVTLTPQQQAQLIAFLNAL